MLPTKFRFIWQSGFKEEDFLEINQSETRIAFTEPLVVLVIVLSVLLLFMSFDYPFGIFKLFIVLTKDPSMRK
jgi:hypothetical protein